MLCIARVDGKQRLPLAHLLALSHVNLHQLAAHLRHDGHVGLAFHLGAKFHGHLDIGFLHGHRFK